MSNIASRLGTLVAISLVTAVVVALPASAAPQVTHSPEFFLAQEEAKQTPDAAGANRVIHSPDMFLERPLPSVPSPSESSSENFDWGYAAIGGAVLLIVAGAGVATLRRRRPSVAVR